MLLQVFDPKNPHGKEKLDIVLSSVNLLEIVSSSHAIPSSHAAITGHGSTMYELWMAQRAGTVAPIQCLRSERYEPYLVVQHCKELPPCQEHFTGYGKNKISVRDEIVSSL